MASEAERGAEADGGAERLGYREALARLRGAQKAAKGVSLYSRHINRPAGRVLAAAAYRAGLSPHQVTVASACFTYTGIVLVAGVTPSWPMALAVYAVLAIGFALDSADGQLARLKGVSSASGEWLDHVVDCVKITALHAAVLISFYRHFDLPHEAWLLLPLLFQLAAVVTYCAGLLTEKLKPTTAGSAPPPPSTLRAVVLLPVDYGVVCAVFLLLGSEAAFRAGYGLLALAATVMLPAFLVKWYRELVAAPAPSALPAAPPGEGEGPAAPSPSAAPREVSPPRSG